MEVCEPHTELYPTCGEDHTYYCGLLLAGLNGEDRAERCISSTVYRLGIAPLEECEVS